MKLRIKRLSPDVPMPEYKTEGACAFDLAVIEGRSLRPGERAILRTGLVVCVPEGHAMLIAPRSSAGAKKGITMSNCVGVIDQDFCGPEDEVRLAVYNIGNETYDIQPGERLAQVLIVPIARVEIEEGEIEPRANRGGFGSTG